MGGGVGGVGFHVDHGATAGRDEPSSERSDPSFCVYACGMDSIVGFLDGPRARDAFVLRSVLDPPWSLRIEDEAPLSVMPWSGAAGGSATTTPTPRRGRGRRRHHPGPDHYVVADAVDPSRGDDPSRPGLHRPRGQQPRRVDGASACARGARAPPARRYVLTGTYPADGEVSDRLLDALPRLVVLRATRGLPVRRPAPASRRDGVGPTGGARPPAGPRSHRRAADLVRPARHRTRRPGSAPRPTRSSGRRWPAPRRAVPSRGPSASSRPPWASPGPGSPDGSPSWSASRR